MREETTRSLQTQAHPAADGHGLAAPQGRLDALRAEVAQWRDALTAWQERIARYHQAVEPLRRELHAAWRDWVLALDHAALQPGLSRAERRQLDEMIHALAVAVLGAGEDAEVRTVMDRHTGGPAPVQADEPNHRAQDEDGFEDWEQQAAAAQARRAAAASRRRATSASRREAQEAQEASQSVREVYRRVASALHPDREPDPAERERKTALMQQANQAYAAKDLLVLLALQLQAEQVDTARAAPAGGHRLQHYIRVLEEQLAELQAETRRLELEFREANGLPPGTGMQPRKADRVISSQAQAMRAELQALRQQNRLNLDVPTLRAVLRAQG